MTMTPAKRQKLEAAWDWATAQLQVGTAPIDVITGLQEHHGATYTVRACTNTLRCAGVTATCTWSKDQGLLTAWRKNASQKLIMENYA